MTLEQQPVNVQELQRLNDAITMTMDAIRRVAPQVAWQYAPIGAGFAPYSPVGYGTYPIQHVAPFAPWTTPFATQPYTTPFASQPYLTPFATQPFTTQPFTTQPFASQPHSTPWTSQPFVAPWHQPLGVSPFVNLQQRAY